MYDIDPLVDKNTPLKELRQGEALKGFDANGAKKYYVETYGCQMNFNDSEIVASVLQESGYGLTTEYVDADLILLNTCSIREKAEDRVRSRLVHFKNLKEHKPHLKIGVLGCMAERLKAKLLEEEKIVDLVVGPDAYRDIPNLVEETETGQKAVNVFLSKDETYGDIAPVRLQSNGVSAFISITRGCDNMCSFCVVPFTRGRERSRDPKSICQEAQELIDNGYKEVTLLGQNVDSFNFTDENGTYTDFADLMRMVASLSPDLRVRFSTSHPKDLTNKVAEAMRDMPNICNYIHLPVQSGNSDVLDRMNRTYDREWYLDRIDNIRNIVPDVAISTDIIAGFCGETNEQHAETISLMELVKFDYAFMFMYSERPGTMAARKFEDDVPHEVKNSRLQEIIRLQQQHSFDSNQKDVGNTFEVLVEGPSKRNPEEFCGRNSQNKMCVFPREDVKKGQYVQVKINECTAATLKGTLVK